MIRYSVEGNNANFQNMVRFLGNYSRILDKYVLPAMKKTTGFASQKISPNIPVRTGAAKGAFFNETLGYGSSLTGVVGFKGGKGAPYHINIVEYGARPHSLVSGSKQRTKSAYSRFQRRSEKGRLSGAHVFINDQWVTIAKHPGFSGRGFMAAGFSAAKPIFNAEMQIAVEQSFNEVTNQ